MVDEMVSVSRTQHDIESEQVERILLVLTRANGPAPLDYISLRTGIKEPLEILKKMEERSLVRRSPHSRGLSSIWSCSMDPMYEIVQRWSGYDSR